MVSISVIGLGYIGLPTASLLANKGFEVSGCDISDRVVTMLNAGQLPIAEMGLGVLVTSAVNSGNLKAHTEIQTADVYILAVPTPLTESQKPDVTAVEAAVDALAKTLQPGALIILESTIPVGTTENMAARIKQTRPDLKVADFNEDLADEEQVYIAHCPERVLPGQILKELVENDRIIGGLNPQATQKAIEFYKQFVEGKLLETTSRVAEMSKLTENAYRDVNIAFANELSMICEQHDMDVWDVIHLSNHHPRVNILRPGPGVGGHCIAVDPWFIVDSSPENANLIKCAREVNDNKIQFVADKILKHASKVKSPKVACLGLAFKPNVDDLRQSPALKIAKKLSESLQIFAVEPNIEDLPKSLQNKNVEFVGVEAAIEKADIVAVLVAHNEFKVIDKEKLNEKILVDACGAYK